MNHRVSIVVISTSAMSRLIVESERPKFAQKPAASQNQSFQKNVCTALFLFYFIGEPCAEFTCSSPLVLCVIYCFSFSGQRSTVVPTQGPSTPLNREFSSISSCSFFFFFSFCQLTIHSQALRLSVCCELQAADEKNLTPKRHVFSRSSQYIPGYGERMFEKANPRRESYTSGSRTPSVAQRVYAFGVFPSSL